MDQFLGDDLDQYFTNHNDHDAPIRKSSLSLVKSGENMHTMKTKIISENNKNSINNKYLREIKESAKAHEVDDHQIKSEMCSMLSVDKKERNRKAAKQSRDRKKLYIQLMEYEQKELESELIKINKQIEDTKSKINNFCSQNKAVHLSLFKALGFTTRSLLETKLQQLLQRDNCSQQEQITIILDSICFRMGAMGRERVQKQRQCYKQIINLSLPPLHRYLIWAATQNKHIFRYDPLANQTEDFICPLSSTSKELSQKQAELRNLQNNIKQKKNVLVDLISKLALSKNKIESVIRNLDMEVDQIQDLLSPYQAGRFILNANSNSYRKQLNFFKEDQQKEFDELFEASSPKKKVKKEQM